jgi:Prolyl oligopeptidase family
MIEASVENHRIGILCHIGVAQDSDHVKKQVESLSCGVTIKRLSSVTRRCTMRARFSACLLVLCCASAYAAEPPPDYSRGQKMLDAYFRRRVKEISDNCLKDIRTKEDWERQRPEMRRQFLDMIGLWPLPPRTDLKATITGTIDAGSFTVEKLHFQSKPGLYVTGNLYVPRNAKALSAVLYVCGHGNIVKDGVSYGSKVFYQHHPTWFAQNGYVCLILDTLELGEIPGEHHGTSRIGEWWWQSMGFTPAGVECWNAMRALDYLETRPEVDPKRMAVTGRSGGGATSWWLAAADDRPQCIIPVAGIADLYSHLIEGELDPYKKGGVISGHCDCMYMVNTYQWDFPLVAALCAPRPLMLGNSDVDGIFPVGGYRRLADKVRKIYDLYGAGEKFTVLETAGPHKDTPELRLGAFRWLNHWLKNDNGPVVETARESFTPQQLKVLKEIPADARNKRIQDTFIARPKVDIPTDPEAIKKWWPKQREEWMQVLKKQVFRGWPKNPPPLNVRLASDITKDGLRLRAYDFVSEDEVELRLWVETAAGVDSPSKLELTLVDESRWQEWLGQLGPEFAGAFPGTKMPERDTDRFEAWVKLLNRHGWATVRLAPRGIGLTRWATDGSKDDVLARRRFALIGQSLDGQRVWDIRRAIAALNARDEFKKSPIQLQGVKEMAGLMLQAAIFEPDIKLLNLLKLPRSLSEPPILLNARRGLDVPELVALAMPRTVWLWEKSSADAAILMEALKLAKCLDDQGLKTRISGD